MKLKYKEKPVAPDQKGERTMRRYTRKLHKQLLATAFLTALSATASAEAPQDRFWAGLEYFYPTITSTASPGTALPSTSTAATPWPAPSWFSIVIRYCDPPYR